jgi:hypothetical protein
MRVAEKLDWKGLKCITFQKFNIHTIKIPIFMGETCLKTLDIGAKSIMGNIFAMAQ